MISFEFATANRIIFGAGKLNELAKQIGELSAKRVLLVRGYSSDAIPRVREILSESAAITEFQVHGEPTVDVIRDGLHTAHDCDLVIGLGGGSAMDAGKAIAALATNQGDVLDYLEVIGRGRAL